MHTYFTLGNIINVNTIPRNRGNKPIKNSYIEGFLKLKLWEF